MNVATVAFSQGIVGHRGASFDAPENTLASFKLAFDQNADGIEGDFYITADQQVVCIHDADTQRTGGSKLDVEASTLAELRALEYGSWKSDKFAGETIPLFSEVLSTVPPGKLFVIELKSGPEIVPLIHDELNRIPHKEIKLLFISFDADTILACKTVMPNIRAHWLTSFELIDGKITPTADVICKTVSNCHADGVGLKANKAVIDADFIASLKAGGVGEFHVWTIDNVETAEYFRKLGAVGITTNRPELLKR